MMRLLRPRRFVTVLGLTLMWCALWGDIAVGTAVAGLGIALVVTSMGLGTSYEGGIRPVPLLRLGMVVLADLVKSTVAVAREIVTPTDYTDESIVAVEVSVLSGDHLFFLVSAITLTPGTAVVDTDTENRLLYLHILHDDKRQEVIDHVREVAGLVCEALPVDTEGVSS